MSESIHFIMTGGTIDSEYFPPRETSVPSKNSIIPEYILIKIKPYVEATFETLFMLDSGDIDDQKRVQILESVRAAKAKKIVICHGTNTMTKTAEYLAQNLGKSEKAVVLTGAMIPLKEFAMSDGGFNLGFAMAEVLRLEAGVYVCMNARTFAAGDVLKNTQEGRFESV